MYNLQWVHCRLIMLAQYVILTCVLNEGIVPVEQHLAFSTVLLTCLLFTFKPVQKSLVGVDMLQKSF